MSWCLALRHLNAIYKNLLFKNTDILIRVRQFTLQRLSAFYKRFYRGKLSSQYFKLSFRVRLYFLSRGLLRAKTAPEVFVLVIVNDGGFIRIGGKGR